MPRPKIAMIGAGSLIFCKTLTMDILATPALQDVEICLMNRTKPKLDKMEAFVREVVKANRLPAKVTATLDRRQTLDGAGDVAPVDVPLDPALAIANRFQELAK